MRVWVDLANSPHVVFFRPILAQLQELGHEVSITARDFAQTLGLCRQHDLVFDAIGCHGGNQRTGKLASILSRAFGLREWAKRNGPFDLAVSHNSYAHCLAGRLLRIPTVTLMDYEHTPANHIAFRAAHTVVIPEVFPDRALKRFGARTSKVRRYPGIKEEVYLNSALSPPECRIQRRNIQGLVDRPLEELVLITMRPPATMALYHNFENPFFEELLRYVDRQDNCAIVLLPRTVEQRKELEKNHYRHVVIPSTVVDGRALLECSDIVIGAGGTMNREAAVLDTPVFTLFAGKLGAVDDFLISQGRMVNLTALLQGGLSSKEVFGTISLRKKKTRESNQPSKHLLNSVVELILGH